MYRKGDKICHLVPMQTHTIDFTLVKDLDGEDRGGGFGSTDRPVQKPIIDKFQLKERTTVGKFLAGQNAAKIEIAKSYYSNYQGELYVYEENGMRGLCVIDASGEILIKTPIERIS